MTRSHLELINCLSLDLGKEKRKSYSYKKLMKKPLANNILFFISSVVDINLFTETKYLVFVKIKQFWKNEISLSSLAAKGLKFLFSFCSCFFTSFESQRYFGHIFQSRSYLIKSCRLKHKVLRPVNSSKLQINIINITIIINYN